MTAHPKRRRLRVVAVLALGGAALALVPAVASAHTGTYADAVKRPAKASDHVVAHTASGSTTVQAPGAGTGATVTVSQTDNLVNQTVEVSWKGFAPSSATQLNNGSGSFDTSTKNPVRVYECRGDSLAAPASSSDCYGSPGYFGTPSVPGYTYPGQTDPTDALPDGPANWEDAVTSPDGTGSVDIQLFTKVESPDLGCDADVACSIVVVPNYGTTNGSSVGGNTEDSLDAPWAWARRTVVPLSFDPTDVACPLGGSSLDLEGSPMAARLLASWRARTCTLSKNAVAVNYTAIGEPQTRQDVGSATAPAGLTIDPLTKKAAASQGVVYAPVANTSLVIAFQVDDAEGRPVTHMNLDPRLVAKLITASYRTGGNAAVAGNPVNLFHDPEFLALNPGVDWPDGSPGNHVMLLGDISDTTTLLTQWIWANKDARAFLQGKPDPWGMTVNKNYLKVKLPFDTYPSLDPLQSNDFQPIQGMQALAQQLSIAQFPGGISEQEGGVTVVTKQPRQNAGSREVIGIIDAGDAADYRLATASLENAGGAFVAPTATSIRAGLANAVVGADKVTRTVDQTSKDKAIYPLAMQVTGAFSTKASKADRTGMENFLDYTAKQGQVSGDNIGQLPPGYVPLSSAQVAQDTAAVKAIAAGYVAPKTGGSGSGDAGDGAGIGDEATGTGSGSPSASGAVKATTTGPSAPVKLLSAKVAIKPIPLGQHLLTLPVLLVLGLLTLGVGPALVWYGRRGGSLPWPR